MKSTLSILTLLAILCLSPATFALKSYTDTYTPSSTQTNTITYYYTNDYTRLVKIKRCTKIITTGDIIKQCKTIKK